MLLVLTNSQDATADYLVPVLISHGVDILRFNTDTSLERVKFQFAELRPRFKYEETLYCPEDFTCVWYRRPERLKRANVCDSSEGAFILDEWTEALDGFFAHIPSAKWINHPAANVAASNKIEQLTTAKSLGLIVPDTLVTQDVDALRRFFAIHDGRVIVKPLGRGYVERQGHDDTLLYTNRVPPDHLHTLDDLPCCPTLFQQLIEKRSDVRITVVDRDIHAVELIARDSSGGQRCDIRRNNMEDVQYRVVTLPPTVELSIRVLTAHYRLRFAAIDMVVSQRNEWVFLEINPNGQWAWLDLAGVTDIAASFVRSFRG